MKKNKIMFLLVAILTVLLTEPAQVNAATDNTTVIYDLNSGVSQTFVVQNNFGEDEYFTIERIEPKGRITNNSYKITAQTNNWTAGFYVDIQSNKIINVYSPFCNLASGSISGQKLIHVSQTEARYCFLYKRLLLTDSTGVKAVIEGTDLIVSKL